MYTHRNLIASRFSLVLKRKGVDVRSKQLGAGLPVAHTLVLFAGAACIAS